MRYYDNTMISAYKECPRKFYWRHVRHFVRDGLSPALIFGLSWHDSMDVVWGMLSEGQASDDVILKAALRQFIETWTENGAPHPKDMDISQIEKWAPRTPGIAGEMLVNYINSRRDMISGNKLLSIERPFAVGVYDESDSQIKYIGRLDKEVRHRQYGIIAVEHKSTSWYAKATGFRREYLESWSPNSQIDGYSHALHMLHGKGVSGVWIDAALVHKTEHNRFTFIPVDRQFAQIEHWLNETRDWIDRIENELEGLSHAKTSTYRGFPKNTGACNIYAGCPYRDLCKFYSKPYDLERIPAGFRIEKWEPFDILKIDQLGLKKEGE